MNKYNVKLSFSGAFSGEIKASTKNKAVNKLFNKFQQDLMNVGIGYQDIEIECNLISWRDNEDYASILGVWGEPSFEYDNQPVWILADDKGLILTHGDLVGFQVDKECQIFDVWDDGHWVHYGEELYKAYFDYISEKELLR